MQAKIESGEFPRDYVIPERYKPKPQVRYLASIQQELLIFVKPKLVYQSSVNFKSKPEPNKEVNVQMSLKKCQTCPQNSEGVRAIVAVINESVFVESDKSSQSPSLITKIFLDKEVYNEDNEFRNSYKYVEGYWAEDLPNQFLRNITQDDRVELLLGNQKFRQFFLDPTNVDDFNRNRYEKKYEKYRGNLSYLLPISSPFIMAYDAAPRVMMFAKAMPAPVAQMEMMVMDNAGPAGFGGGVAS